MLEVVKVPISAPIFFLLSINDRPNDAICNIATYAVYTSFHS